MKMAISDKEDNSEFNRRQSYQFVNVLDGVHKDYDNATIVYIKKKTNIDISYWVPWSASPRVGGGATQVCLPAGKCT